MSTYIKAGLWTKKKHGNLGELDLDLLISQNAPVIALPVLFNKSVNGTLYSSNTNADASINDSILLGKYAGQNTLGIYGSVMIGPLVGTAATNSNNSVMIGSIYTGYGVTNSPNVVMIGTSAGQEATGTGGSTFIGGSAGYRAVNSYHSNFIGIAAGFVATGAADSNFIGTAAGYNADNAYSSNFIGVEAGMNCTGNNVNAFGTAAGKGNTLSGKTIFSNTSLPSYVDRAAAVAAITVVLGASAGSTYLYYNATTFGIEAIRL